MVALLTLAACQAPSASPVSPPQPAATATPIDAATAVPTAPPASVGPVVASPSATPAPVASPSPPQREYLADLALVDLTVPKAGQVGVPVRIVATVLFSAGCRRDFRAQADVDQVARTVRLEASSYEYIGFPCTLAATRQTAEATFTPASAGTYRLRAKLAGWAVARTAFADQAPTGAGVDATAPVEIEAVIEVSE
jgi:hypothetical protein